MAEEQEQHIDAEGSPRASQVAGSDGEQSAAPPSEAERGYSAGGKSAANRISLVQEVGWLVVAVPVAIVVGVVLTLVLPPETGSWVLATVLGLIAGGVVLAIWQKLVARPTAPAKAHRMAAVPRPEAVTVVQPLARSGLSRRNFILASFFGGLGLATAASLGALWNMLYPRKLAGFGGTFVVNADQVPKPGDPPLRVIEGKFWLVNLKEGEGTFGDFGQPGPGGLLALYQKCPHLGCAVPWRGDYEFGGEKGWFLCPCHGSTYTKAGIRVAGPAPRPMDTMEVTVDDQGRAIVNTGRIRLGGADNPLRVAAYQANRAAKFFRQTIFRG